MWIVCAMTLPIPGVYFAETTTFLNESFQEEDVGSIKKGDVIYTLSEGSMILTTVKISLKIEGRFGFVDIHLICPEEFVQFSHQEIEHGKTDVQRMIHFLFVPFLSSIRNNARVSLCFFSQRKYQPEQEKEVLRLGEKIVVLCFFSK